MHDQKINTNSGTDLHAGLYRLGGEFAFYLREVVDAIYKWFMRKYETTVVRNESRAKRMRESV